MAELAYQLAAPIPAPTARARAMAEPYNEAVVRKFVIAAVFGLLWLIAVITNGPS